MELHQRLCADMWCVSREDLRDFRRRVRLAIADGTLTPTAHDGFDASDDVIGPCMHTVMHQLVKPVTHAAGDMSWALMRNREGLSCDLFVTHAWQEGVFEFIDKVLHSWPRGARGAYCCILSNPQNLDIGGIISCPRDSPFARALAAARFVMVVPNSRVSIYSRIWCAYEAFLAYEQSKMIFTASSPTHRAWLGFLRWVAVWLALSLVLAVPLAAVIGRTDEDFEWDSVTIYEVMGLPRAMRAVTVLFLVIATICIFRGQACTPYSGAQRACMCAGLACEAVVTAMQCHIIYFSFDEAAFDTRFRALYFRAQAAIIFVGMGCLCAAMSAIEVDNLWHLGRMRENSELLNGYSGRLHDAQASRQEDADHIFGELESSGNEAAANNAVRVLIQNGMSTPRLRQTVEKVGELQQAGYWNLSYVTSGVAIAVFLPAWAIVTKVALYHTWAMHRHAATGGAGGCQCHIRGAACLADGGCEQDVDACSAPRGSNCVPPWESPFVWANVVSLVCALTWVWIFARSHPDIRRFRTISMTRIYMCSYAVCLVVDYLTGTSLQETDTSAVIRFCTVCLVYALLIAGPVRLASIPRVGPPLVHFFFANMRQRKTQQEQGGGPCAEV